MGRWNFAHVFEGFSLSMPFGFNDLVEWRLVGTDVFFHEGRLVKMFLRFFWSGIKR